MYESPPHTHTHMRRIQMPVSACVSIDALSMSNFIHLSSKAPWVIERCYIILLCLVCFVAESWRVSLVSLFLCLYFYYYKHTHTQTQTDTHCSSSYGDDNACQSQTVLHHLQHEARFSRLLRGESHRRTNVSH